MDFVEKNKMKKTGIIVSISTIGLILFIVVVYLLVLPFVVTKTNLINHFLKPYNIKVENPYLKTYINSNLDFGAKKIKAIEGDNVILQIDNLNTSVKLSDIFIKKLVVNNLSSDYIYADVNSLLNLFGGKESKKQKESDFSLDLYNSILDLKKALIVYKPNKKTEIKLHIKDVNIDNTQKQIRYVHFNFFTEIKQGKNVQKYSIQDKNKVVIKNKHLYIEDCIFNINKSSVHINGEGSRKNGLIVNLSSKDFMLENVVGILRTDLIIPNGSEILSYFDKLSGKFNFDINLKKTGMEGKITLKSLTTKLSPLAYLPVTLSGGTININPKKITLEDFSGYWGLNKNNKALLEGYINDYLNSCDTKLEITTSFTNEFVEKYLSKTSGVPLKMTGETKKAGAKIIVKSIYDKIDVILMSKLNKGDDILVDNVSLTPVSYDRAIKADMHLENNLLDIKEINYYIASNLVKGVKVKPVVVLRGRFDISKPIPDLKVLGFEIPNPLPSEFLNLFVGQKLFKGGKFSGKLYVDARQKDPLIRGKINAEEIKVPSQRIYIKNAELNTDKTKVHLNANGRFKRSDFVFRGDIKSALTYPIIIHDLEFELDKLDLEKLMASFNETPKTDIDLNNQDNSEENPVTFDFRNLIVEKCILKLNEGSYKDIKFGNLKADLTFKDGILHLHSNKFDIADGISTVKVLCDLVKHKYYLRLGIKDVNSDVMSTTLLNLPKEISGAASGLIELNTDKSMKLNGIIKFAIKNGQIQKIGLVEYLMKFASIFRNPLVSITPSIFSDIINIPEGKFDKISGELNIENNFVKLMKITSSSPQLSSYIVGCYNLENSDAILRIYTKFSNKHKGIGGVLRKISLSSLANRIPLSSRNDAHYYASELKNLPKIDADEKDVQIFLTTVDGDVEHNNFLSSLKKIK